VNARVKGALFIVVLSSEKNLCWQLSDMPPSCQHLYLRITG
jgi:hypothetical protein